MTKYCVKNGAGNNKIAFSVIPFEFETSDQVFATVNININTQIYSVDFYTQF